MANGNRKVLMLVGGITVAGALAVGIFTNMGQSKPEGTTAVQGAIGQREVYRDSSATGAAVDANSKTEFQKLYLAGRFKAMANEPHFKAIAENVEFARLLESEAFLNLMLDSKFRSLLESENFMSLLEAKKFDSILANQEFQKAGRAKEFGALLESEAFQKLAKSGDFQNLTFLMQNDAFMNEVAALRVRE